jgi:amino acid transporter
MSAFCACFYYFTGFETYATMGSNVHEPAKNIGKGILIVSCASTLFYLIVIIIFLAALPYVNQNVTTAT